VFVPKAAMHKDDSSVLAEYQVRASGELIAMQLIAEPEGKQPFSDYQFGLRVLAPNPRHAMATLFFCEHIRHASAFYYRDFRLS